MNRGKIAISAFAAGAAFMYFSDPNRGKRRRALVRDKVAKTWHQVTSLADKAQRDMFHRAEGAFSELKAEFGDRHPDDVVLIERVRSHVGRAVSHPHAMEVGAQRGKVTLKGPVLADEVDHLLQTVRSVPGVEEVVNRLEIHEDAGKLSSLQGGVPREHLPEFMQQNWTPALRMAAGTLGGALIWHSARSNGAATKTASALAGAALLTRVVFNREFSDIAGIGGGGRVIEIDKAVHVHASVEEVFKLWSNYRVFPRFMAHLKEVDDYGNGISHWVAAGPAGVPVSWDAEVTKLIPNKLMAWRSLPGSTVQTEGRVRFDKEDTGTRVGIRMFYKPPGGMIGHYLAGLLGADAKHDVDDDMVRFKSLIELGHTRAHGKAVMREDLKLEYTRAV